VLPSLSTSAVRPCPKHWRYGGDGIALADPPPGSPFPTHAPHFTIDSAAAINQLNDQVATEIALFSFSSSVGGFTFKLALGDTADLMYAESWLTLQRKSLR
jgi:hypothetical protein